jgi:uncharacterized protein CbrC (UPF0167 family)
MTFDDLGMHFPLWAAPIENAAVERDAPCRHCANASAFTFDGACYACLRADKCDHAKETELGMVRREDAMRGMTHGVPLGSHEKGLAGWELVPHPVDPDFPDEKWVSVRVDKEELLELLRTPSFHSWQDDTWLFCCKKACIFLGDLPSDMRTLAHVEKCFDVQEPTQLLEQIERGSVSTYAFRRRTCDRIRAYFDMD